MIAAIDLIVLALVVVSAIAALSAKDLMSAAILFGIFSFCMCVLFAQMGAVDVAFTESAVGAGVSTVLMIATIFRTTRRTSD